MLVKILSIIMGIFGIFLTASAQVVPTLQTKESIAVLQKQESEEKIFRKLEDDEHQRRALILKQNKEIPNIDYFLETKVNGCTSGICFGMIPFPVIYSQSKSSNIQFLAGTSIARTGFLIRIKF